MSKIYLSGPMTGLPCFNYPEFNRVAQLLRDVGNYVYNPAEKSAEMKSNPRKCWSEYCRFICLEADEIVLLHGWEKSLGVSAELALAKNCGLKVTEYAD